MSGVIMSNLRFASIPAVLGVALIAGGCPPQEYPGGPAIEQRELVFFDDCDELLAYVRTNANQRIDEYGNLWGYGYGDGWGEEGGEATTAAGEESGGEPNESAGEGGEDGGKEYSGTNVQEAGVDEPDVIKTDGDRILALARGVLYFVDASGVSPVLRGSLDLGADAGAAEMLLHGDRAVVMLPTYGRSPCDGGCADPSGGSGLVGEAFDGPVVRLIEVDLRDPDVLRVAANLYVSGELVSSRMVDGVARIVVRSSPRRLAFKDPHEFIDWPAYEVEVGLHGYSDELWQEFFDAALAQAKTHNKSVVDASTLDHWLPSYVLEDLTGGSPQRSEGLLLDCASVMHAGTYVGLSTLSVLTVDLSADLALGGGVAVFSEGETVYASQDNLYVAHSPWQPRVDLEQGKTPEEDGGYVSYVHKFDIRDRSRATYLGSGEVRGRVRSQWSLSEWQGDLRLATTDQTGWDTSTSENFVSVLREQDGELVQVGQVGGLGLGEEIQGVRFIGGVGYVVTYRQTDPLYTLDLSDPATPRAVGELKIPGFSAYLHPVGEGLILGVGRDGTPDGQVLGLQLSLFDVADLANPVRLHQTTVGSDWGWSEALFDHRAFLWWPKTRMAMLPVEWSEYVDDRYVPHMAAYGFTVDPVAGISALGAVEHPETDEPCEECWAPAYLRRSLVIEDLVYTLSDVGLKASRLTDLEDVHWLPFEP